VLRVGYKGKILGREWFLTEIQMQWHKKERNAAQVINAWYLSIHQKAKYEEAKRERNARYLLHAWYMGIYQKAEYKKAKDYHAVIRAALKEFLQLSAAASAEEESALQGAQEEAREHAKALKNVEKDVVIEEQRVEIQDLYRQIEEQSAIIKERDATIEELRRGLPSVAQRFPTVNSSPRTPGGYNNREPSSSPANAWIRGLDGSSAASSVWARMRAEEDSKLATMPWMSPSRPVEASLKAYRAQLSKLNYTNLKQQLIEDGASKEKVDACRDTEELLEVLERFRPTIDNVTWRD